MFVAADAFQFGERDALFFEVCHILAVLNDDIVKILGESGFKQVVVVCHHCVTLSLHLDERTILGVAI